MNQNRREFGEYFLAVAAGLFKAELGKSQEKNLSVEVKNKARELQGILKRLELVYKNSGVTTERVSKVKLPGNRANPIFLEGLLTEDLPALEKIAETAKMAEQYASAAEANDIEKASPEKKPALTGIYSAQSAELDLTLEQYLGLLKRWDKEEQKKDLEGKNQKIQLTGLGEKTKTVQQILETAPKILLAGLKSVDLGKSTGISDGALTISQEDLNSQRLREIVLQKLANVFNWDFAAGLTPAERLDWYEQSLNLEKTSSLKEDDYYKSEVGRVDSMLSDRVKSNSMTEQMKKDMVFRTKQRVFMSIASGRQVVVGEKFSKDFPKESQLAETWFKRGQELTNKMQISFEAK